MTATPVDKTYTMLMVADMQRALRFYTEAWIAPLRSAAGSPVQHPSVPMSGFGSPKLLIPKAT